MHLLSAPFFLVAHLNLPLLSEAGQASGLADLRQAGVYRGPVLLLQNLVVKRYPRWHFAVVKGFDLERGRVTLNSGLHEDYEMSLNTFERKWGRWPENRNLRMVNANLLASSVSVRPCMG